MAEISSKNASIEHISPSDAEQVSPSHSAAGTSAISRRKQPLDPLSVTPKQMNDWKIPYNKETGEPSVGLAWVRNPDSNIYNGAPENRIAELQYEFDGSGPVLVGGKSISRNDVVLYQYPIEYKEQQQREIDAASNQFEDGLHSAPGDLSPGATESTHEFDIEGNPYVALSRREQAQYLERMSAYHRENGMIGNHTGGMELADAVRASGGPEAVKAEQAMYRDGAAYHEISQDDFSSMFSSNVVPMSKSVRSFHGIGDTGLGQTTQTKVAARSAAGRRSAALAAGKGR